jgi:hypothetical protein
VICVTALIAFVTASVIDNRRTPTVHIDARSGQRRS